MINTLGNCIVERNVTASAPPKVLTDRVLYYREIDSTKSLLGLSFQDIQKSVQVSNFSIEPRKIVCRPRTVDIKNMTSALF